MLDVKLGPSIINGNSFQNWRDERRSPDLSCNSKPETVLSLTVRSCYRFHAHLLR